MTSRRGGDPNLSNLLAQNMTNQARNSGRLYQNEGAISGNELAQIRTSIQQTRQTTQQQTGKITATQLILEISRLQPAERNSDYVIGRVTDYFFKKGETSLNKWQVNAVVRQMMASRVSVTHDDINVLEELIRRKETGLPGSKMTPKNAAASVGRFKNVNMKPSGSKIRMGGANSPLAMNASRSIHMDHGQMSPEPLQRGGMNQGLNQHKSQVHASQNLLQNRGAMMDGQIMQDPYDNLSQMRVEGGVGPRSQVRSSYPLKSGSIGILPGINQPIPKGLPSLAEYGSNPHSVATDSSILQLKQKRANRLTDENNRLPRHKASLNKQFTDEVLSPVKKNFTKLDYTLEQQLSSDLKVELMPMADQAHQAKRFASNLAKKNSQFTLSSSKQNQMKKGQFNTIANSPSRPLINNNAYESLLSNQKINNGTARVGGNSMSQLQIRKGSHNIGTAPNIHRESAPDITGLSEYMTSAKLAYNNNQRIPVVQMKDNAHLRYRPGANTFNDGEADLIQKFDDRDQIIKELDTGMSPFMKNQNDHMQRMKRNVARQEAIASQYERGELTNFSNAEAKKDQRLFQMNAVNAQRKDQKQSNYFQGESFKRKQDNNTLKRDLMEQIQQKRTMEQMEKSNKLEQERIQNDRDNIMRKQHAIMQAQRRQLQAKNINSYNDNQNIEKHVKVAQQKQDDQAFVKAALAEEIANMPVAQY